MFYTYVLKNEKSDRLYTGSTNDLRKRFKEHRSGRSVYTAKRGPYKLIYYEACSNKGDARTREKYLKTGMGKRYIQNRLKRFLSLTG
jgi:putative endonuclease